MRRLFAIAFAVLLMPLVASAEAVSVNDAEAAVPVWLESGQAAWLVPAASLNDGSLADASRDAGAGGVPFKMGASVGPDSSQTVVGLGGDRASSTGITVGATPHLYSGVRFNHIGRPAAAAAGQCGHGILNPASCTLARGTTWRGGTLVGGFRGDGFLIDVGFNWMRHDQRNAGLLLVVPDTERARVMGIPSRWIDSLSRIKANGQLSLGDSGTWLNMGASIGRIRLVPAHARVLSRGGGIGTFANGTPVLGAEAINQKAVSLGLGNGTVSGVIVGRLMQTEGSLPLAGGLDQQWSALDLGITVRLPWEGELQLGAQNLWSSGGSDLPKHDGDPIQGRIPYIEYHQNL